MVSKDDRFGIHNVSRGRQNRTVRAAGVARGLKQYIGGTHRLIRGQVLVLTAEQISLYIKELTEKEAAGLIEVRTLDGRLLSLADPTKQPDPVPPGPPVPVVVLDSIANDQQNVGQAMPQFPGGDAVMDVDPNKVPELVAKADVMDEPTATPEEPSETASKKKKGNR